MFEDDATERQGKRMLAGGRAAKQGERADESGRSQWAQRTAEVIGHQLPRHTARIPDYEMHESDRNAAHRVVASAALGMHAGVENNATCSSLAMALNVHIGLRACVRVS
jgi:hypothetical protein